MPERTLAEAVAEIRLSDRRFAADLAALKAKLVAATQSLEKDAQISVSFKVDDKKITSDVAKLKQAVSNVAPVVTPTIDTAAEQRIQSRLSSLKASLNLTADPAPAIATGNRVADRLAALRASLHLDADPTGAIKAVDEVGAHVEDSLPQHFEKAGDQSGSRFGAALTRSFKAVTATVGVAAGGFIAGALVTGFQRLTTIEDATASLTVQLGDATKAAQLLDQVLNVVRGTPFNLDQFARAAANMVSFGVEVQKIPKFLTAIGEAAASQGGRANEVAQRLSLIFGQITTANRIGGQEILQFSEAGVNALAILGNHFGKTTTEIRDMISNGVVPAKQALDILAEGILHGTNGIAGVTVAFEGTMAKLRNTLTGSIGGFKAATARFGVELIQPFKEGIIAAFNGATAAVDSLGARAAEAFAGIADSDFIAGLVDALKNLPALVDQVVEGLGHLGPALAPLLAVFGASGLGAIKSVLGPTIGQIVPAINPLVAAIGALVAFSPELRQDLLPTLKQLFDIVIEFGGVAGVAIGKITDALVPVGEKLIKAFGQLVPVAKAITGFGEGILAVAVPAIEVFSAVIDKIPVAVITALVAAFAAFKLITPSFNVLEKSAQKLSLGFQALDRSSTTAAERMELGATRAAATMQKLELAVAGAFSGMALASKQGSTQVVGAIGAITSIATGFAVAQGPGAAIAGIGVALGLVVGHFTEAAREAAELKKQMDAVASSFADATLEILKSRDALVEFNKSGVVNLQNELGKSILTNDKWGESMSKALAGLNLPSSGTAGAQEILRLFQELSVSDGDLTKVPQLVDTLTASFGANAPTVARLIDQYGGPGGLIDTIKKTREQMAQGPGPTDFPVDPEIVDLIKGGGLERGGDKTLKFLKDLLDGQKALGSDDSLAKLARDQIDANSSRDEAFRVAIRMAEAETNLNHVTGSLNDNIKIQATAMKELETNTRGVVNAQVRDALKAAGASTDQINAATQAAKQMGVNIEDTQFAVELLGRSAVDAFHKQRDAAKEATDATTADAEAISLTDLAAQNLAAAIALSKEATAQVTAEVTKLHKALTDTADAQTLVDLLQKAASVSTNIVNEKDLAERAKAEADLADTKDKILQLQADVADENAKAAGQLLDLQAQRAKAVALGSTRGVEAIDRDIAHVFDKAKAKEGDLAAAEAKAAEVAAHIAELPAAALTQMQQLRDQAAFTHVSLLDLIIGGPTPESRTFFNDVALPIIQKFQDDFVNAAKANPKGAEALAKQYRDNLSKALLATGVDEQTAGQLIGKYFDISKVPDAVQKEAKAAQLEYTANLRKAFEADRQPLTDLAKKLLDPGLTPEARDSIKKTMQDEFDKANFTAGVELRPLTDADIAQLQQMITIPLKAIPIQDMAADIQNAAITTPLVNIIAQQVSQQSSLVAAGQINPNLGARGPGGAFLPFREGGVFTEAHVAQIVSAGMFRVFAEPETGGEGYVPLSPHKRTRSLSIMAEIADIFGYQLERKDERPAQMTMPAAFVGGGRSAGPASDADAIGRAVAHHTARVTAARLADRYDHAVHVEKGAIVIAEPTQRKTAVRLVSQLAELAFRR